MAEANETTVEKPTTETATDTTEQPTPSRPKLSDEELLNVLEGRAQRLRTKLGKSDPAPSQTSDDLVQKTYLRAASITDPEDVKLALDTAKKWNMPLDQLVDDPDFKEKLEKAQTQRANEAATSGIKDGPGAKSANQTPEFYIARGTPPTREEVPDRSTRVKIINAMAKGAKGGKTFYND